MVGAPDVVQPWMPRAARDSDACLWHVNVAGGARRRGCAAAGVPEFFNGPLDGLRPGRHGAGAAVLDQPAGERRRPHVVAPADGVDDAEVAAPGLAVDRDEHVAALEVLP